MESPNWFVPVAIGAWPLVAIVFYRTMSWGDATLATILGGLLLLPPEASIKFQMIPAFDKNTVPNLCALVGCLFFVRRHRRVGAGFGLAEVLAITYVISPIFTSTLNNDSIIAGSITLPGVGYYDGFSSAIYNGLFLLTFFIGRYFFQEEIDIERILSALVIAGVIYSVLALFEIRMSPQLSRWVYGYFNSSYVSEFRSGGFRPVVFMINGLSLSFFMMTAFLATLAFWRSNVRFKYSSPQFVSGYLGLVIILCKSAGALVYTVIGGFFVRWMKPKLQLRIAVLIACIGLIYPVLRLTEQFPTKILLEAASAFSDDRANSLAFRFDQEEKLLAHAAQRIVFGWGRYGRNRVYDEESGRDESITDGEWILTLGQFGFVGFLAQFGLLSLPVFRAASAARNSSPKEMIFLAALALIVALTVIEQLPNASITPWSWLLAGALLGRGDYLRSTLGRKIPSISNPDSIMRDHPVRRSS